MDIKINVGNSINDINTLKKELASLKKTLDKLVKGSDAYLDVLDKITKKSKELSDANLTIAKTTKDIADKMTVISASSKEMKEGVGGAAESVENLNENIEKTGEVVDNVKVLRNEIKELKSQLVVLDKGSEEYAKTLQEVANKQRDLNDMNTAVRNSAADLGQKLNNIVKLGKGIAGGFAVAQGAMALFGAESENLEKIQTKLQAAIALVNGLQGLEGLTKTIPALMTNFKGATTATKTFIKSLNGVKAAIASTGIGALVVALGLLVANWGKINDAVTKWLGISKNANDRTDSLKKSMEEQNTVMNTQNRIYALNHTAVETLSNDMNGLKASIDGLKEKVAELNKELENAKWYQWGKKKDIKDAIQQAEDAITEGQEELKKKEQDLLVEQEKERLKKIEEAEKEDAEKQKAIREKTYEDLKKQQDNINAKTLVELKVWYNKELAELQESDRKKLISHQQYLELVAELDRRYAENGVKIMNENEDIYKKVIDIIRTSRFEEIKEIEKTSDEYVNTVKTYVKDLDYLYESGQISAEEYNTKIKEVSTSLKAIESHFDTKKFEYFHKKALSRYGEMWEEWSKRADTANKEVEHSTTMTILELERLRNEPHMLQDSFKELSKQIGDGWFDIDLEKMKTELDEVNKMYIENKKALEKQISYAETELQSEHLVAGARWGIMEDLAKRQAELQELELAHTEEIARREIEIENRKKAVKEQILNATLDTASDVFGAMSALMKKESKAYKISASAQALIDTYKAANSAYSAMASIPYVGPALGIAASAAAIASGLANVKAIWATDENSGSSGNVKVSTAVPTATTEDPYAYTRNLMTSSEEDQMNAPTKVYVLESDITSAQNKVQVAESEGSF